MRFPYIRQTVITFPVLSLFPWRFPPQPEPERWPCIREGGGVMVQLFEAAPTLALHTKGGVRSHRDVSFGASANNITGGNALGDVLQALIPFVS